VFDHELMDVGTWIIEARGVCTVVGEVLEEAGGWG
jgi:hypothetical protein